MKKWLKLTFHDECGKTISMNERRLFDWTQKTTNTKHFQSVSRERGWNRWDLAVVSKTKLRSSTRHLGITYFSHSSLFFSFTCYFLVWKKGLFHFVCFTYSIPMVIHSLQDRIVDILFINDFVGHVKSDFAYQWKYRRVRNRYRIDRHFWAPKYHCKKRKALKNTRFGFSG